MSRITFTASDAQAGTRVDLAVAASTGLGRAALRSLFDAGAVRVAGRRATKGQRLEAGAVIEVDVPEQDANPVPEPHHPLDIVYQDDTLLICAKPAGLPCQPLEAGETGTLVNRVVAAFPEVVQAGATPREGGLCHRLDTETSGVLLVARTRAAWDALREQFRGRTVEKRYEAIVRGPLAEEGLIELPLAQRGDHSVVDLSGNPCQTRFAVRATHQGVHHVEVELITGFMHQIRAHFAAIGAPLIGDVRYGGTPGVEPAFLLHAGLIGFDHPRTGRRHRISAPPPPRFTDALHALGLG